MADALKQPPFTVLETLEDTFKSGFNNCGTV